MNGGSAAAVIAICALSSIIGCAAAAGITAAAVSYLNDAGGLCAESAPTRGRVLASSLAGIVVSTVVISVLGGPYFPESWSRATGVVMIGMGAGLAIYGQRMTQAAA